MVLAQTQESLLEVFRRPGQNFGQRPSRLGFHPPIIHPGNILIFKRFRPQEGLAPEFRFRINPDNLKVTRGKIEEWTLTGLGFEHQFWTNDLIQFNYSGSTGTFRLDETSGARLRQTFTGTGFFERGVIDKPSLTAAFNEGVFDIRLTRAWQKFTEFDRFYQASGPVPLQMSFWPFEHPFIGRLNDFSFDLAAGDAYQIKYNFKFTAVPDHPSYFATIVVRDEDPTRNIREIEDQRESGIFIPRRVSADQP